MSLKSMFNRVGEGTDDYTPMQIAESELLTHSEKIEMLHEMKAKVTGAEKNEEGYGPTPEEIDRALAAVKKHAQDESGVEIAGRMAGR